MKKTYLCLLLTGIALISLASEAFAWGDDWYVSAANYGRYYHFKETATDSAATRFQYDIYMGDFYSGGWYEVKHVMNETGFTSTENELTRRYFGWENNDLTVHVGHFYEVYDRGLVLNTFRDDEVSVDLVLDGIKLNWRKKYFDLDFLSAVQNSDATFRPIIRGAHGKLKPLNMFHFGGAYVSYIGIDNNRQNISQVNQRFMLDFLDIYAEYARRKYDIIDIFDPTIKESKTGDALYVNSTAYYSYFSALFEYKNYYDMLYPSGGNLNTPPAVNPQDRLLSTEAANVFNPIKGERGYRLNLGFALNDYWGAEFDYSAAKSRSPETVESSELFAEIRGSLLDDRMSFKAGIDFFDFSFKDSYDSVYVDTFPPVYIAGGPVKFERNEIKPEFDIEYLFDDYHSIELDAYLIKYDYKVPSMPNELPDSLETHSMADSSDFTEKFLNLTFSRIPSFRLTIGGSLSDKDPSPDPDNMAFIEVSYIWGNHELIVFQGEQRGGLVCSGGVCSFHPTFKGLRVTLLSRL